MTPYSDHADALLSRSLSSSEDLLYVLACCGANGVLPTSDVVAAVVADADALLDLPGRPPAGAEARWLEQIERLELAGKAAGLHPDLQQFGARALRLVGAACDALPTGQAVDRARARAAARGILGLRPWCLLPVPAPIALLDAWIGGDLGPEEHDRLCGALSSDPAFAASYRARLLPALARLDVATVSPAWDPELCGGEGQAVAARVPIPHTVAGGLRVLRTLSGFVVELPDGTRRTVNPTHDEFSWSDPVFGSVCTHVTFCRDAALDRRYAVSALASLARGEEPLSDRAVRAVCAVCDDLTEGVLGRQLTEACLLACSAMRSPIEITHGGALSEPILVERVVPPPDLAAHAQGLEPDIVDVGAPLADEGVLTDMSDVGPSTSREAFGEEWAWLAVAARVELQRIADDTGDFDLLERIGAIDDVHADDGPALYWVDDAEWRRLTDGLLLDREAWWAWGANGRGRRANAPRS